MYNNFKGNCNTEQHAKGRANKFYRGEIAKTEYLFNSQNFDAVYNVHKKIVLFANCVLVRPSSPNLPVYVLVRLRLEWGFCGTVSAALYDIGRDELLIGTKNDWTKNIFKVLSDEQLSPNIDLVGVDIDQLLSKAEDTYLTVMRQG
jgi:hypothetical protein